MAFDLSLLLSMGSLRSPWSSSSTPSTSAASAPTSLKTKGIGRGAEAFQTSVRRVAIPPEIAARIRRGEEVSADEITRAMDKAKREQEGLSTEEEDTTSAPAKKVVDEDWLPESAKSGKRTASGAAGKRKKK